MMSWMEKFRVSYWIFCCLSCFHSAGLADNSRLGLKHRQEEKLDLQAMDAIDIQLFPLSEHRQELLVKTPFNLRKLIYYALKYGYESKEQALELYRAKQRIGADRGRLTPQISGVLVIDALSLSWGDVTASLIGFIYPSHWYNYKKSKKNAKAEMASFQTFLADRVDHVIFLYYHALMHRADLFILDHYAQLAKLIEGILLKKRASNIGEIDKEALGIISNLRIRLASRRSIDKQHLYSTLNELSYAIALKKKWKIKDVIVPFYEILDLDPKPLKVSNKKVLQLAPELKTIDHLIAAARLQKRESATNFLSYNYTGNPLGYGYGHRLRIAKSHVTSLINKKELTKAQLWRKVKTIKEYYTSAATLFRLKKKARNDMEGPRAQLIKNLVREEIFDLQAMLRFFEFALEVDLGLNEAFHTVKMTTEGANRYHFAGKWYKKLLGESSRYYKKVFGG